MICVVVVAGLPDARGQLREDRQDYRNDGDSVVADNRHIYAWLHLSAGTCVLRSDAGTGLNAGEGVDAGDTAAGTSNKQLANV